MSQLGGLLVLLAYVAIAFAIFWVLPPAWRANWHWYGPPIGLLGWGLIAHRLTGGQPFQNARSERRERLKASVNPPYRHLGR
ncbi:MAG: hypothetical protein ACO1SV_15700 [Fimbriimonas sp.]